MSQYVSFQNNKILNNRLIKKSMDNSTPFNYDLFDLLPQPILIQKNNSIIYANAETLNLMGFLNTKDLLGKSIFQLISFTDNYNIKKFLEDNKDKTKKQLNCRITCADKSTIPITIKLNAIEIDSIDYDFIVIEDISKLKKLEKESTDGIELHKKLLNISPDGVCLHDGHIFFFASSTLTSMLGFSNPLEIMGKKITDVIPNKYHDYFNNRVKKISASDEIFSEAKYKFITTKNNLIDVEWKTTRLYLNGRHLMLSSIRDTTEKNKLKALNLKAEENKKLLEKTIEYEKLKTEFFSNISHELRTPLNILLSALQLINVYLNTDPPNIKSTKKYVGTMRQNCFRLLRLINNLLDITKIDSGFYHLILCNHNIIEVVENITLSIADYLKDKKINIIFDTDIEEKIIACDEEKIERIILNLISNAIKFTDANGTINVNIYDGDSYVKIIVKDNGIGIPKAKLNTIFDRFSQVDKTIKRNSEGTGIGLALVKSLVELHKGKIEVKSEYGHGTEFTISLPVTVIPNKDKSNLCTMCIDNNTKDSKIEKMHIEFSDIYF
ncbi:sensor histidine kinase [Clostridium arbusti]|uniref:sensor histidine kinase n=1 Tax=Clostridium arbusti TaxID=1137848 RepID=UPI0002880088|nr:ATP-binding protein [Clostridium arbusti]